MQPLHVELLGLLVPVRCAGCGRWDEPWCPQCAAALDGAPSRCEQRAGRWDLLDGPPAPVWCLADFVGPVRQAISAWKDGGRADLGPRFREALRCAVDSAEVLTELEAAAGTAPVMVVGVPSAPGAVRRRGADLVSELTVAVAAGCADAGLPAVPAQPLARRGALDSAGLGARARMRNLDRTVRVRSGWSRRLAGVPTLLVDDVLTTGATFAACRRALQDCGAEVIGGVVLASTPAPGLRTQGSPTWLLESPEQRGLAWSPGNASRPGREPVPVDSV